MGQYMGLLELVIKTSSCTPEMGIPVYSWIENVIKSALLSKTFVFNTHLRMVFQMFKDVNLEVQSRWLSSSSIYAYDNQNS